MILNNLSIKILAKTLKIVSVILISLYTLNSYSESIVLFDPENGENLEISKGELDQLGSAISEGLQKKYDDVYYGPAVREKLKVERSKQCTPEQCAQNILINFDATLIAEAIITKETTGYTASLKITDIANPNKLNNRIESCDPCSKGQFIQFLKKFAADEKLIANNTNNTDFTPIPQTTNYQPPAITILPSSLLPLSGEKSNQTQFQFRTLSNTKVVIDGVEVATSDLQGNITLKNLPANLKSLILKKNNYFDQIVLTELKTGLNIYDQQIIQLKTTHGKLAINSIPDGASIYLGGEKVGTTPLNIQQKWGKYQLEIRLVGFSDDIDSIQIIPTQTLEKTYLLKDQRSFLIFSNFASGTKVILSAIDNNQVKKSFHTPVLNNRIRLPEGKYNLTLSKPDHEDKTIEVALIKKQVLTLTKKQAQLRLKSCKLTIKGDEHYPNTQIKIKGTSQSGETIRKAIRPSTKPIQLTAGEYQITQETSDKIDSESLTCQNKQTHQVNLSLVPKKSFFRDLKHAFHLNLHRVLSGTQNNNAYGNTATVLALDWYITPASFDKNAFILSLLYHNTQHKLYLRSDPASSSSSSEDEKAKTTGFGYGVGFQWGKNIAFGWQLLNYPKVSYDNFTIKESASSQYYLQLRTNAFKKGWSFSISLLSRNNTQAPISKNGSAFSMGYVF